MSTTMKKEGGRRRKGALDKELVWGALKGNPCPSRAGGF